MLKNFKRAHATYILFALAIAAYFTASQPITPAMAAVSSLAVIGFAVPSYRGVIQRLGKKGALLLVTLGVYALVIESLAIHTGLPYGEFVYNETLGSKVFGLTPWTVAFAYPPIALAAYWLARKFDRRHRWYTIVPLTALFATTIDLVLDPAAVAVGFWYWDGGGFFYDVPLVNFAGWLLTGSVAGAIIHSVTRSKTLQDSMSYSGLAIVWFWTIANLTLRQWVPVAIGFIICSMMYYRLTPKTDTIKD